MPTNLGRCAAAVLAAGFAATSVLVPATPAAAAPTISCLYMFTAWPNGFIADLYITNYGPVINGWTARWTFNESIANLAVWQAIMTVRNGHEAIATNMPFNATIQTGQTAMFGWSATTFTPASTPTDITVNGVPC